MAAAPGEAARHAGSQRLARGLAVAGVGLLLVQATAIVVDALARWLLDTAIHGLDDFNRLLIPVTVTSFLPALFAERGNIRVELLGQALGPRARAALELFGQTLGLAFILLIAWQYGDYAAGLDGRHTVITGWPLAPAAWAATGLLAFAALVQAGVVLAVLRTLRRTPRRALRRVLRRGGRR